MNIALHNTYIISIFSNIMDICVIKLNIIFLIFQIRNNLDTFLQNGYEFSVDY